MRNSSDWYQPLAKDLAKAWPTELPDVKPALLCQVELGLRLLERLDPSASARGVYTLLSGYPFATAAGTATTADHQAMLTAARHLLWKLRRRRTWHECLEAYIQLPERLRGYRITAEDGPTRRVEPTIAGDRYTLYDQALSALPGFERRALPLAGAGPSRFVERRRPASVNIPEQLRLNPAPGHDLTKVPSTAGIPVDIPMDELAETARWMDQVEQNLELRPSSWAKRLGDLRLDTLSSDGQSFEAATFLHLDRMLHLVGMVGAGKSTLMTLIAVWGARKGLRTTLVVGDVAEQLTLTNLFRNLGLATVPILGGTTRERHAARLHRRLAARGLNSLLAHDNPGFDDLSTVCVVDALRGMEAAEPLRYADAPCNSLRPVNTATQIDTGQLRLPGLYSAQGRAGVQSPQLSDNDAVARHGCPIWSACPRHRADRDMVDALIWVANPASLVQSAVPQHLNEERLRRLELACLRSDIIIVDEADRVQMQLDAAFAPAATLVIRGPESWLDRLHTHKIDELARQGRLPLSERDVQRWGAALDVVSSATNRLYAMLISNADLRNWADIEYFSAWTLQEKLIADWYPQPGSAASADGVRTDTEVYDDDEALDPDVSRPQPAATGAEPWAERRREVVSIFDSFRDDPLGDHGPYNDDTNALVSGARDLLHTLNELGTRQRVHAILDLLLAGSPITDGSHRQPETTDGMQREEVDTWGTQQWRERTAIRLEFTLLLATLHHRLDRVSFMWPQVEAAMHLDTAENELARRPPLDYAPVVPEAPMGNVLGFQYLPDEPEPGGDDRRSGTLRFFRCAGVGRELLLNLPSLGADPANGRPGPHVLLMSGTSWAGTSTRAHILVPVGAVLKPDERALQAIRQTTFRTHFLYENGAPLTLSGARLEARHGVLRQIVTRLGKAIAGQPSPLDQELRQVQNEDRRRALLLVGSYREAAAAANLLQEIPRWNGRVRVLIADDAELVTVSSSGMTSNDELAHATAVRRGDLAAFAEDPDAELLVAPLMAIERGHNILNAQRTAAFGVVFFLARPHPRPDDLSLAVFAINDWVTRFIRDQPDLPTGTFSKLVSEAGQLDAAGLAFRRLARREWRRLLSRRYAYSRLSPAEQTSFAWDQMVTIWQVIGRLVRGGVPARVVFVDAAFAPAHAEAGIPRSAPSTEVPRRRRRSDEGLLAKLHDVLTPYFDPANDPETFANPADPALVRTLYEPLYDALCGLRADAAALAESSAIDDSDGLHVSKV